MASSPMQGSIVYGNLLGKLTLRIVFEGNNTTVVRMDEENSIIVLITFFREA